VKPYSELAEETKDGKVKIESKEIKTDKNKCLFFRNDAFIFFSGFTSSIYSAMESRLMKGAWISFSTESDHLAKIMQENKRESKIFAFANKFFNCFFIDNGKIE
jgi:hypothetical protein